MRSLSEVLPVWPPVREQTDAVRKCILVRKLDDIAEQTQRKRPYSCQLTATNPPTDGWKKRLWVLKRERSSCAEHVMLPNVETPLNEETRATRLLDRYQWLVQEYMPLLKEVGEWRVVVIEGRVEYVVFTHSDEGNDMTFVPTEEFKTLGKMW
jgi:hypothetical protein